MLAFWVLAYRCKERKREYEVEDSLARDWLLLYVRPRGCEGRRGVLGSLLTLGQ
jgi:hypothetical protein